VSDDIELIEEGWDSLVAIVDDHWIARIPRTPQAADATPREVALLELLARRVPVAVPEPVELCPEHGAMLYPRIDGAPLDEQVVARLGPARLAEQVAAVLAAVHDTPLETVRATETPDLSKAAWGDDYTERWARFKHRVVPLLPEISASTATRFLDRMAERMTDAAADGVLVHRDLGPAHVLCATHGVSGIIDWSDACIGDRAIDLAWLLEGTASSFARELIDRLAPDADTRQRALLYHQLGPWFEVEHGLDTARDHTVTSGIRGVLARLELDGPR
jgi:aminoglycoside phosphotransferase (APT) family kinase protein